MNKQQLQEIFKILINEKRFLELSRLIKKSKTLPADYSVRIAIKKYLEEERSLKTKLFFIIKLLEITTVNLDANILMDICKLMLDIGTPYTLVFFAQKIEINEEIYKNIKGYIQKHYTNYIKEGKFVEITKLMEVSKIKPSENLVFEGYKNYLMEGNIISFVNLQKRVKIDPKKDLILEMFDFYKNKSSSSLESEGAEKATFWNKRIEKLSGATGIELEEKK